MCKGTGHAWIGHAQDSQGLGALIQRLFAYEQVSDIFIALILLNFFNPNWEASSDWKITVLGHTKLSRSIGFFSHLKCSFYSGKT